MNITSYHFVEGVPSSSYDCWPSHKTYTEIAQTIKHEKNKQQKNNQNTYTEIQRQTIYRNKHKTTIKTHIHKNNNRKTKNNQTRKTNIQTKHIHKSNKQQPNDCRLPRRKSDPKSQEPKRPTQSDNNNDSNNVISSMFNNINTNT